MAMDWEHGDIAKDREHGDMVIDQKYRHGDGSGAQTWRQIGRPVMAMDQGGVAIQPKVNMAMRRWQT